MLPLKPEIREESPASRDVEALLRESDALAAVLYPGEYRRPINAETLAAQGSHLFVARMGDMAVGCCILFDAPDGTVELKRMIVSGEFRQRGVGAALLRAAESAAIARGVVTIRMEVGTRNIDGQALYRREGYVERGPFGTYKASPISLFFEKTLTA